MIAVIPARAGSRRIVNKNIQKFCESPMISYPIRACLDAGVFSQVIVYTDSEAIAEVALRLGAKVPYVRSAASSGDHATLSEVLCEFLTQLSMDQELPDLACVLATAVFLDGGVLKEACARFLKGEGRNLISVARLPVAVERSLVLDESGCLGFRYPQYRSTRSQDLPVSYYDAGQFYFLNSGEFARENQIFGAHCEAFELDSWRVQDIDTWDDFKEAELKYKYFRDRGLVHG